MHSLPFYRGCNLSKCFPGIWFLFRLDLIWLVLICPEGSLYFIRNVKKAQEFLNMLLLFWHFRNFLLCVSICMPFLIIDSNFIV